MHLTKEQVSNLALLADFMEGLVDPNFTMEVYRHDCRTPACAFGHACTVPALVAQGLSFNLTDNNNGVARSTILRRVFGDVYEYVFQARLIETIKTPQQWAAHCRAFLKENGYEVVKSDGFEKFMKKVTEPVDTEEFHPWRTA